MLVALGVLILIIGLAAMIVLPSKKKAEQLRERGHDVPAFAPALKKLGPAIAVAGILCMLATKLVFYAEPGYQYFMVYPNGTKDAQMTEGYHLRWFAKITPWQKYIDVKIMAEGENSEDVEGIMEIVPIRFIDQVTAEVDEFSARFQLPVDEEHFKELAVEFRTSANLVNNTLIPTVREVISNTGYMFSAQDYISGSSSDFRVAVEQQIKDGSFSVKKTAIRDSVKTNIQDADRKVAEISATYEVTRRQDEFGKDLRIPHEINNNHILVAQVITGDVLLDPDFQKRLENQRDESAKRQLEQQKIKTAKDAQARIIAEGERDKAAERVEQEKIQVKELIAIETKLKQQETQKQLAQIELETARLDAQSVKVAADAEAYQNQKLVQAGLTPQQRAMIDKETKIGIAAEIAKTNWPETMIISSGGEGGGVPLEALLGTALTQDIVTRKKPTVGR